MLVFFLFFFSDIQSSSGTIRELSTPHLSRDGAIPLDAQQLECAQCKHLKHKNYGEHTRTRKYLPLYSMMHHITSCVLFSHQMCKKTVPVPFKSAQLLPSCQASVTDFIETSMQPKVAYNIEEKRKDYMFTVKSLKYTVSTLKDRPGKERYQSEKQLGGQR